MGEIYHGDCMTLMSQYPDKYFDLCVADPPYGINITGRHKRGGAATLVGGEARPFGGVNRQSTVQTKKPAVKGHFILCSTTAPRRTQRFSGSWSA